MRRAPGWSAVTVMIAVCAAIYLLRVQESRLILYLALFPKLFWHGYLWQAFTYQFLHGGFLHILLNSLVLWSFGPELEHRWGSAKFTLFFLVCGVGGGIAAALGYVGGMQPIVGMSGSIFGLVAAQAAIDPNRRVFVMLLPIPFRIRDVLFVVLGSGIVMDVFGAGGDVAHWAHLGGAVTGYLYMMKDEYYRRARNWYYRRKLARRRSAEPSSGDYDDSYTTTHPHERDWS